MFDGTLKFDTRIDSSGFASGIENLGNIAKSGLAVFGAASAAAAAGLAKIGKDAVSTGQEFSAGMSQIGATLGYSVDQINDTASSAYRNMQALTEKAEEMGAKTAFSATQAAEGLNILAQSGYNADESIQMIDSVLDMAAAGNLQLGQAASYISGSMKGFTKEAGSFADNAEAASYYADMIAKGATLANTNVQQLGEALSDASSSANTYGQSARSTEVALLRLAEQNEVGSAASTMLAATMKNLYSPTDQAKQALADLGVSAYDAGGKARDFNTVVDELRTALYQISDEGQRNDLENIIFGIQGQKAFDKMVSSSAEKVQYFYSSLDYTESGAKGSAALQAETMLDNLAGDIQIFQSATEGFRIALFKNLDAPLRKIVRTGTDYMSELTEGLKNGNLPEVLKDIFTDALTSISHQLNGKAPELLEKIKAGIAEKIPELKENFQTLISEIREKISEKAPELLESGKALLEKIKAGIAEKIPGIAEFVKQISEKIRSTISEHLPEFLESGKQILSALLDSIPENLKSYADYAVQIISALAGWILENLPLLLDAAGQILTYLFDHVLTGENLSAVVQTAVQILSALVDAVTDHIDEILLAAESVIKNLLGELGKPEHLEQITEMGVTLLGKLIDGLGKTGGSLLGFFWSLYHDMTAALEQIDWMTLGGKIVVGIMKGLAHTMRDAIAGSAVGNGIEKFLGKLTGVDDFSLTGWADYLENDFAQKYEKSAQDAADMIAQYRADAVRIPDGYDIAAHLAASQVGANGYDLPQISSGGHSGSGHGRESSLIKINQNQTLELDGRQIAEFTRKTSIDDNAVSGGW